MKGKRYVDEQVIGFLASTSKLANRLWLVAYIESRYDIEDRLASHATSCGSNGRSIWTVEDRRGCSSTARYVTGGVLNKL